MFDKAQQLKKQEDDSKKENAQSIENKEESEDNTSQINHGGKDSSVKEKQISPEVANSDIRTMPEKFLSGGGAKFVKSDKSGKEKLISTAKNKNLIIGIVVGVLVLALVGLGAWFLLESVKMPESENLIVEQTQQEKTQQESQQETQEEAPLVEESFCSADNCEACTVEECLDLVDSCHLEDECEFLDNILDCPSFICLSGAEPKEEEEATSTSQFVMAEDMDFDLLTDVEEGLWGTSPTQSDTDGDGYNDGEEIKNLYDPTTAGEGTGKLIDSGLIENYISTEYGYSIYYPSAWQQTYLNDDKQLTLFNSKTDEFVEVIVQENISDFRDISEWYIAENFNKPLEETEEILVGNWVGLRSADGLNVYLLNDKYIYTILYNVGLKTKLNYLTTFEMMFNSFKVFESPVN